jgi:hypothetical protein
MKETDNEEITPQLKLLKASLKEVILPWAR